MKIMHLGFRPMRYRTKTETQEQIIKRLEDAFGIIFTEEDQVHGIVEKAIVGYSMGFQIRLDMWHDIEDYNELVFKIYGSNTVYTKWEQKDIINIDEYIQELLKVKKFEGWYYGTTEEGRKEGEYCGLM
jgi:hypothetical protein